MRKLNIKTIGLILSALFLFSGCASMITAEKDNKRSELDLMAKTAIDGMLEQDAELQKKMDDSLGYFVANMKVTKVPVVGGGEGVFVNTKTNDRIYFTVSRFDIGGGRVRVHIK